MLGHSSIILVYIKLKAACIGANAVSHIPRGGQRLGLVIRWQHARTGATLLGTGGWRLGNLVCVLGIRRKVLELQDGWTVALYS